LLNVQTLHVQLLAMAVSSAMMASSATGAAEVLAVGRAPQPRGAEGAVHCGTPGTFIVDIEELKKKKRIQLNSHLPVQSPNRMTEKYSI
jgi:phosphate-selective porin